MWVQNHVFITDACQYVLTSNVPSFSLLLFFFKTFLVVHASFVFQTVVHYFVIRQGENYPSGTLLFYKEPTPVQAQGMPVTISPSVSSEMSCVFQGKLGVEPLVFLTRDGEGREGHQASCSKVVVLRVSPANPWGSVRSKRFSYNTKTLYALFTHVPSRMHSGTSRGYVT